MVRLRLIRHSLLRLCQIDNRRRALVIEAVACLFAARLALILIPFPRLALRLGPFVSPVDLHATQAKSGTMSNQAKLAEEIGWAVTRSARYMPVATACPRTGKSLSIGSAPLQNSATGTPK